MPGMTPEPILSKPRLPLAASPKRFGKVAPPLRSMAAPRQMYMVPRVAMKAGTFIRAIRKPENRPMMMASTNTTSRISGTLG